MRRQLVKSLAPRELPGKAGRKQLVLVWGYGWMALRASFGLGRDQKATTTEGVLSSHVQGVAAAIGILDIRVLKT